MPIKLPMVDAHRYMQQLMRVIFKSSVNWCTAGPKSIAVVLLAGPPYIQQSKRDISQWRTVCSNLELVSDFRSACTARIGNRSFFHFFTMAVKTPKRWWVAGGGLKATWKWCEDVRSFPNKRIQKVCFEMSNIKHLGIYTLWNFPHVFLRKWMPPMLYQVLAWHL